MARLTQSLRLRLAPAFRDVLALNKIQGLTNNRLSGAVLWKLQQAPEATDDQLVNSGVDLMSKASLPQLLREYDAHVASKRQQASRQVLGIINNLVPQDMPNREQVIADTEQMLQNFKNSSIQQIRRLVQARMENGNRDIDPFDYELSRHEPPAGSAHQPSQDMETPPANLAA